MKESFPSSGPAAVTELSIQTTTTTSLSFRWSPPEGEFEGYDVFLYAGDDSLHDRRSGLPSTLRCSFLGLTPGAPFRLVVLTRSGEQTNDSAIWARTSTHVHSFIHSFILSVVHSIVRTSPNKGR